MKNNTCPICEYDARATVIKHKECDVFQCEEPDCGVLFAHMDWGPELLPGEFDVDSVYRQSVWDGDRYVPLVFHIIGKDDVYIRCIISDVADATFNLQEIDGCECFQVSEAFPGVGTRIFPFNFIGS